MKLMTEELAKILPALYETETVKLEDKLVVCKFFTPDSNWTWYAIEYDPEERMCWGYVKGFEGEFGYFSLDELEGCRGSLGLPIERDLYWIPKKCSEIKDIRILKGD